MNYLVFSFSLTLLYLLLCKQGETVEKKSPLEPTTPFQFWYDLAKSRESELTKTRRDLHKIPEPMLEEFKTSAYIKSKLTEYGIPYIEGWAKNPINTAPGTGITADIGTGEPPCIMLRCDIDALPLIEDTGIDYVSEHHGYMHGCGHDAHISWILGAGYMLNKNKDLLNGTVRLMFQPGQEAAGGSKLFLDEGLLDLYPPIQEIYGFHVAPGSESFKIITCNPNYTTYAAGTDFMVRFKGTGGTAYNAYKSNHPLQAAIAFYNYIYDFQTYISDHYDPSLVTMTILRTKENSLPFVVPDEVEIWGTFRALSEEKMDYIEKIIRNSAKSLAELYNCSVFVRSPSTDKAMRYPTYSPDKGLLNYFNKIFEPISLNQSFDVTARDMGSEDVGFITSKVPSMFASFGTGSGEGHNGQGPTDKNPHSPWFQMDDRVLPFASAVISHLAVQTLGELSSK